MSKRTFTAKPAMTRRAAVLAGLIAIGSAPLIALADTVTKLGYRADGNAYEGLVTVEGKTYLYIAGEKFEGGHTNHRGERYFHPSDGHMAVSEEVTWDDGTTHRYGTDGVMFTGWLDDGSRRVHFDETTGALSLGWFESLGSMYCADAASGEITRGVTCVDPAMPASSDFGSIYDFADDGKASWHLPTFDDLPGGSHGQGAEVPEITQGDRRQRTIMYALSRVGCPYANSSWPTAFVCDGLTEWSYEKGTGEDTGAADGQWQLIKARNGDPWHKDQGSLKPGDLVFWGDESLTWYEGALSDNHWPNYHAGLYYANGRMINARSATGVTDQTVVADYAGEMGWAYLGGGSPYAEETSHVAIPSTSDKATPVSPTAQSLALGLGDWDYTDWDYVETMRQRAIANGGDAEWYATNDCDFPCRDTFFKKVDGLWRPVAGFYAAQGHISDQGHSVSWKGIWKIEHRNERLGSRNYVTCYMICNPVGDHDCQAYHDGWNRGESGYQYGGCSGLTTEHAKWIYDQVPDGCLVDVCGNATDTSEDPTGDTTRIETFEIKDPFK